MTPSDRCNSCGARRGENLLCPECAAFWPDTSALPDVIAPTDAPPPPTRIGVLVPTVDGREDHLARCVTSHCPPVNGVQWLLAVESNHPTCAEAWVAGVDRLLAAGAEYVCVTCDDFEALGPWWIEAVKTCDGGAVACPILFNAGETIRWPSSADDGEPGELARCTRSPNLFTAAQAEAVFAVYRQLEPMQYYGDFLLGDIAGRLGIEARVAGGFTFSHHWAQVGRHSDEQNEADHGRYQRALHLLDTLIPGGAS